MGQLISSQKVYCWYWFSCQNEVGVDDLSLLVILLVVEVKLQSDPSTHAFSLTALLFAIESFGGLGKQFDAISAQERRSIMLYCGRCNKQDHLIY